MKDKINNIEKVKELKNKFEILIRIWWNKDNNK